MKFIKILILSSLVLLVSCSNFESNTSGNKNSFNDELKEVYSLYDQNKIILDNITDDIAKNIINDFTKDIDILQMQIMYGSINDGIIRNNGQRISVFKIPIELSFEANEENIKKFLNRIVNFENKIVIDDVFIEKKDEIYKLSGVINLCALANGDNSDAKTKKETVNIEEIGGRVVEKNKINLRNSDLLMTLRPYNSDSATVSLGLKDDILGDSYIFYDVNEKINLDIKFNNENNIYYCEYLNSNNENIKTKLTPKSNEIMFDILSCAKASNKDYVGINVNIINNTEKNVNVKIFDDNDNRVNVEYSVNVEVNR